MTEPSSSSAALSLWLDLSAPLPDAAPAVAQETLEDEELHAEGLVPQRGAPRPAEDDSPPEEVPLDLIERHARDRLRAWVVGAAPSVPPHVGRFTLLRRVGAGGMGTVYAAYDDELDRKVALKFLHPAKANDPDAQHRLLREAQALARLSHPNLVPVFEVGRFEGQVYLAMELVAGRTMRAWIEEQAPPWRAVLEAWIAVGRALAVVHAEGLVHRDVKPDNVLVGNDGRPRLVDFGLAREVGEAPSGTELELALTARESPSGSGSRLRESVTRSRAVVGTPAYLAPEQRMGEPSGPAADQYGFCVSLYEGLYGCRPPGPVKDEGLVRVPEERRVPVALRRALSRGLAFDPRARFGSMEALVVALERPLRRRRVGWMFGSGAVAAGVLIAAIGSARSPEVAAPVPCAGVGTELDAVWNEAARAQLRARGQAGAQPVLEAFAGEWSAVRREVCEATRVAGVQSEAVLDRRMACLDRQGERFAAVLQGEPGGEALAELPAPRDCSLTGVAEGGFDPPPPHLQAEVAQVHVELARARQLAVSGQIDLARTVAADARARAVDHEPTLAAALVTVGVIETFDHRGDEARAALERAVDLAEAHGDLSLKEEALGHLVRLAIDVESDAVQARRTWHHDAATLRRLGASRHRTAGLFARFGLLLRLEGDLLGAELGLRVAVELYEREGPRAGPVLASSLRNLANVLWVQGRSADAETLLERARAVDVHDPTLPTDWGESTPGAVAWVEGKAQLGQGRLDDARLLFEQTLVEFRDAFGPHSLQVGDVHAALAQVAVGQGRLEDARRHAAASDLAYRKVMGADHPHRLSPLSALGTVAFESGHNDDAVEAFDEAVRLAEATLPADSLDLAQQRSNLAEALLRLGQAERARRLAEQALATMEAQLSPEHADLAFPLRALGEARVRQGEPVPAIELPERARGLHERDSGYPADTARPRAWLARALHASGRSDAAQREATVAVAELSALGEAYAGEAGTLSSLLADPP